MAIHGALRQVINYLTKNASHFVEAAMDITELDTKIELLNL